MDPKVAICISGQPRNVVQNWEVFKYTIIDPNDADVFIHTVIDPDNPSCIYSPKWMEDAYGMSFASSPQPDNLADWILENIQPKGYWFEDGHGVDRFPTYHECYEDFTLESIFACDVWSMHASMFKANEIKSMYENKHGFKYDYVIRTRFDVCPYVRLPVFGLDKERIYTSNKNWKWFEGISIDDHINIGSSETMDKLADSYLFIDVMCNELGLVLQGESPAGCYIRGIHGMHPHRICPAYDPEGFVNGITRSSTPPIKIEHIQDGFVTEPYEKPVHESWKTRIQLSRRAFSQEIRDQRYEWIVGDQIRKNAILS
jgi:hypothetical protein